MKTAFLIMFMVFFIKIKRCSKAIIWWPFRVISDFFILFKLVVFSSSNNKTLNARLLARVITGCHYT
jgi:hypothetical protein